MVSALLLFLMKITILQQLYYDCDEYCRQVTRQFPLYAINHTYIYSKYTNTVTTKYTYNINNITQLHITAEENTALHCTAYATAAPSLQTLQSATTAEIRGRRCCAHACILAAGSPTAETAHWQWSSLHRRSTPAAGRTSCHSPRASPSALT